MAAGSRYAASVTPAIASARNVFGVHVRNHAAAGANPRGLRRALDAVELAVDPSGALISPMDQQAHRTVSVDFSDELPLLQRHIVVVRPFE